MQHIDFHCVHNDDDDDDDALLQLQTGSLRASIMSTKLASQ